MQLVLHCFPLNEMDLQTVLARLANIIAALHRHTALGQECQHLTVYVNLAR
jgi:hypothetical protein